MSPSYSQHHSTESFHRSPSGDSTPYSPPEDINELVSPQPRPPSSPFSVGTTPAKTSQHSTTKTSTRHQFTSPLNANDHDEPYSPPCDITTMRELDLPTRTENPYLDPSNFAPPNANLQLFSRTFDSLIGTPSTSPPLPHSDSVAPPILKTWPSFLLSLELKHEELKNALLYLAQLIAYHTDHRPQARVQGHVKDGMLCSSPLQVFTWEEMANGKWMERMSPMMLRSGILQGVRKLNELQEAAEGVRMHGRGGGSTE